MASAVHHVNVEHTLFVMFKIIRLHASVQPDTMAIHTICAAHHRIHAIQIHAVLELFVSSIAAILSVIVRRA